MKQTVNGVDVVVDYDHFPFNPIEGSDVKFILFHKRYNLGHKHDVKHEDYSGWDEMRSDLESQYDYVCPVYMYEHSGIAFKTTSFGDRWDSGQIGFACANYKDFGLTEWEDVDRIVCGLLDEYEHYINGDIFMVTLYDSETSETIDCMSGFYSEEEAMKSGIEQAVKYND